MESVFCPKCSSILPLAPGEECQICGFVAHIDIRDPEPEYKEVEEFYYQSNVDKDDHGVGIWKRALDEQHCMQMHNLDFKVKKIIRKIPVAMRRTIV